MCIPLYTPIRRLYIHTYIQHAITPHSIIEKIYEDKPSEENRRILKAVEKYLPVSSGCFFCPYLHYSNLTFLIYDYYDKYTACIGWLGVVAEQIEVDDDQLVQDTTTFSIGLGVALGMIMKKERYKEKKKAEHRARKKQRELDLAEEKRNRPEAVRRRMFEHMALMKTRRDFRVKQMNYVFPEESDLSSLPVAFSKTSLVEKAEEPEPKRTHYPSGQRITKYT
jgi:hypothetical protein